MFLRAIILEFKIFWLTNALSQLVSRNNLEYLSPHHQIFLVSYSLAVMSFLGFLS